MRRRIRVLCERVGFTLSSDRAEVGPWGLFGGLKAQTSRCVVISPDGKEKRLPSKVTTTVPKDHVIIIETPGGGGWADPRQRDPQSVRRDVIAGIVSHKRARDIYGVAFRAGAMEVDEEETKRLRVG